MLYEVITTKNGPALAKAGDTVEYTITVTNDGSTDSPDLTCTVTDTLLGIDQTLSPLAQGQSTTITQSWTIPTDTPGDTYVNTANVTCDIAGFTNQVGNSASHTINLVHPSFTMVKSCTRNNFV